MAKQEIHVRTKDGQTAALYHVLPNDQLNFHNHGTAELKLTFTTPDIPLCDNQDGEVTNPLAVPAGGESGYLKICKDFNANEFAYDAQIEGFGVQDPIVIIERTMGGGIKIDATSALIGAIAGLLAGLILAKLMKGGRARNPA